MTCANVTLAAAGRHVRPISNGEADPLLVVFDGLVGAVLGIAPLFMGGRHPLGRLILIGLVTHLVLVWMLRQRTVHRVRYRWSGLEPLLLAGLLLVGIQCVSWPTNVLQLLSPRLAAYLPVWQGAHPADMRLGTWKTISLSPTATRSAWCMLATHSVWLVLLLQRLRSLSDVTQWLRRVAMIGVGMALLGLLQYFAANGKFLWVYDNPYRSTCEVVRGPFYNENHFAHLLILTFASLWAWGVAERRVTDSAQRMGFRVAGRDGHWITQRSWIVLGMLIVLVTICLTYSRGGLLTLALLLGVIAMGWRIEIRWRLVLIGGLVGLTTCVLMVHGLSKVTGELGSFASGSWDRIDAHGSRRQLWEAAVRLATEFWPCGIGVGSFRDAFPLFYREERYVDYAYAESGYLQIAAETGACGICVFLAFVTVVCRRMWRLAQVLRADAGVGSWGVACAAAIVASGFHAIFDFVWFIPACLTLTLGFVACVWQISAPPSDEDLAIRQGDSQPLAWAQPWLWAGCLLVLCGALGIAWPEMGSYRAWEVYLHAAVAAEQAEQAGEPSPQDDLERRAMIESLREAARRDPRQGRVHLRLAELSLRQFEWQQTQSDNPMSLGQIREAAMASNFRSQAEQDAWLDRLLGDRRKLLEFSRREAKLAAQLAPLQGQAYGFLAELAFLHDPRTTTHDQLLAQALRVRPYDATILYAMGQAQMQAGQIEDGLVWWRRAYAQDQSIRRQITELLADSLGPIEFVRQFQPALPEKLQLARRYQMNGHLDACRWTTDQCVAQLLGSAGDHDVSVADWQGAYSLASSLHHPHVIALARHLVAYDGDDYSMRRRLALELVDQGQLEEARGHLTWCAEQNPLDRVIAAKLAALHVHSSQR